MPRVSGPTAPSLNPTSSTDLPTTSAPTLLEPLAPSVAKELAPKSVSGVGRGGSKKSTSLGGTGNGAISISSSGRILVGGKLPSEKVGSGGDVIARVTAANLGAKVGGLFGGAKLSEKSETSVRESLLEGLANAPKLKGVTRRQLESSTTALLIDLAAAAPTGKRFDANAKAVLETIAALPDREMAAFYLYSAKTLLGARLTASAPKELAKLRLSLMPVRPPVDAWTEDRAKPLVIAHSIHPEFWKEELAYFSKKNGFTLEKKNAKDTERNYSGLIKDPSGVKAPLKIELHVRKHELDYLEGMSDPKVHVILYSGHSALGGNGEQALDAAGAMKGPHPKLVMAANCRGKDNYASFTNKYPDAHVIMTDMPTYSVSGQARIEALFDTLARGEDYKYMRKNSEVAAWDEPANNYFYPDEWRKFRFMDSDSDGQTDGVHAVFDRYFDPGQRVLADKFVRALNFTNTELFYHWEVDHENGKKSFFGQKYGDNLLADGKAKGALPGERLVEVTALHGEAGGKKLERWRVQYDGTKGQGVDENLYAALVTMQTVLSLTQLATKKPISKEDALRAVLMGAQGIHYLDVYEDTNPVNQKAFFKRIGLGEVDPKLVDDIFVKFDAHASGDQIKALEKLLTEKYGVDLAAWLPTFVGKHA